MRIFIIVGLLFSLTGCAAGLPRPMELGGVALMRTMSVDVGEEPGTVAVQVTSEEENAPTYSARRATVAGACQAIRVQGENTAFLGHVDRLLLGEGLSRSGGIAPTLRYFSRDPELGLATRVWLAPEGWSGEVVPSVVTRTAEQVLADLLERGNSVVPSAQGDYVVLSGNELCCWVTGPAARGLELAEGCPAEELLELTGGAVQLSYAALTCVPVFERRELVGVELDLRLRGRSAEGGDLRALRRQVEGRAEQWLRAAVSRSQVERVDFLDLKTMAGRGRPESWRLLCAQWEEKFPELEIELTCTAAITSPGGSKYGAG